MKLFKLTIELLILFGCSIYAIKTLNSDALPQYKAIVCILWAIYAKMEPKE